MKLKQIASNMTELHLNNGTIVLFSYETPVAAYLSTGKFWKYMGSTYSFIQTSQKYSRTTTKHINKWLSNAANCFVNQSVLDELVK